VRHHHEQATINLSIGSPAFFAIFDAVFDGNIQRIEEDPRGFLITDTVLALVGEVLCLIPFEPDLWHFIIVTTFLPLFNTWRQ
jgi:hypothetical protein